MQFFLQLIFENPLVYLIALASLMFSLVLHNIAQTLTAASFGDLTAKTRGFTSTDPQRHLQSISLLFLALLGFAIPNTIPITSRNIRGRGGREAITWLAGPLSMLLWAFLLLIIASLAQRFATDQTSVIIGALSTAASMIVQLAVVFIVPVSPLPGAFALAAVGGRGAKEFLNQTEMFMTRLQPFGFMLVFIILSYTGILQWVTNFILRNMFSLLQVLGL